MGDFKGHAIPGTFFFLFGLWSIIMTFRRHFRCRQSGRPFYATATFPISFSFPFPFCAKRRVRNFPVESVVKMVLCACGVIIEIIGGTNSVTHRFDSIGNTQHITMYSFFGVSGVLDILVHKDMAPLGSDYVAVMMALLVEGALFKFHLFGRSRLDVLLHTLLLYVIAFTVVVIGLEAAFRKASVLPVLRGLLLMVQGTWFWGVGYILYNPFPGAQAWDQEDHHALMLAVVCFSWHVAANLILTVGVGGLVGCCFHHRHHGNGLGGFGGKGGGVGSGVQYSKLSELPLDVLGKEEDEEEEREGLLAGGGGGGGGRGGGATAVYRDEERGGGGGGGGGGHDGEDLSDLEFEAPVVSKGESV